MVNLGYSDVKHAVMNRYISSAKLVIIHRKQVTLASHVQGKISTYRIRVKQIKTREKSYLLGLVVKVYESFGIHFNPSCFRYLSTILQIYKWYTTPQVAQVLVFNKKTSLMSLKLERMRYFTSLIWYISYTLISVWKLYISCNIPEKIFLHGCAKWMVDWYQENSDYTHSSIIWAAWEWVLSRKHVDIQRWLFFVV